MKLAYLLNMYPMTSTTFIRREIEALEALGQPVTRFAVRHWDTRLVDADDTAEQGRTEYLMTSNVHKLLLMGLLEIFHNPRGLAAALPLWWRVLRKSATGPARHVGYLLQAIFLRRRAHELSIDHIHAHFSTNSATVAMLSRALGGPPYSFTVHGPDELVEPWRNSLDRKVENSAFVVAITNYCRWRIEQEAPALGHKIKVIGCGLDLDDFTPEPLSSQGEQRFLCVGRLCTNKAQILIPAAVALVRDEFPDIRLTMIGDGEHRGLIEQEIRRYGLQDTITLLGWRPASVVREQITGSVALLLPSLAEGLPIVLMEAMALERPVLTTFIAGIPELVDHHCGWVFPAGSVEEIANALRSTLRTSPEVRMTMGAEGRRRIAAAHDIRRSATLLLSHFSRSVAPHP